MPDINFTDAQQALGFINPQQLRIETEVYQIKYPSFDYSRLMHVDTDGDMWDIGSVFFSGDIGGKAEFLSSKGFDMPFADIAQSQYLRQNQLAGIGYEWSLGELQRAARLGQNLSASKASAASRIAERFIYGIAISGHAEKGWTGLINDPNVPVATAAADGTGSATAWSTKTPDQINRDFNLVVEGVYNASGETEIANRVLLPTSRLQYLARTRIGDTTDTILKFVRENNAYTAQTGQPLEIIGTRELAAAGAGGTARMMAYNNSKDVVQLHLPGPHEFLPAFQKSSMTWEVAGIMNVGGVEIRLPKGASYLDGI
jgi:hypothetical protein